MRAVQAFFLAMALAVDSAVPASATEETAIQDVATQDVATQETARAPAVDLPQVPAIPLRADVTLQAMIGQMLLIGFPGGTRGEGWQARVAEMIQSGRIGGVILFAENILEPRQVKRLTAALLARNGSLPPYICVDQEGGTIQRLTPEKGFSGLPAAQRIGTMDPLAARELYRKAAQELGRLGINCNFGPVVDLNIDPDNPAIGRFGRSYDRDPQKVLSYAQQFIDAHVLANVLTAAKHFPGHGSARGDPHDAVVDVTRTWQEAELEPFRSLAADNSVDMIMIGHLIHPRFSDGDRPASLSRKAVHGVLRTQLGYGGLVVSDDLDMGAIRSRYAIEEAAVMAVEAGSDLLMIANIRLPDPAIADRVIAAVVRAIAEGRIGREAIEQSYDRILKSKAKLIGHRADLRR